MNNEVKVKGGIASFIQLVKSINQRDNQLDFAAAMDWLGRESKTGTSLIIDLNRLDNKDSSSDNSSASSEHSSYDSDYMDGGSDSNRDTKRELAITNRKIWTRVTVLPMEMQNLNILTSVCGDVIVETLNDDKEEISVNESNNSNTNFPDDLFNVLYGKSPHHDEVEDEGVQDGQKHRDKSGGLEEYELYGKSLHHDEVEDEGVQNGQQHQDKSGGLEERQDSDKEQQDHRPGKTGEDTLSKSQRKRLRKKERDREKRNRDQEEDQEGDHESNRNNQEEDSAQEVDKRKKKKKKRKKQSSDGI